MPITDHSCIAAPFAAPVVTPILEIRSATVYRGRNRVFHDLDLTIEQGRHTVILGPNGSGKTTLLKLLARELYPAAGPDTVLRLFGREHWDVWELRSRLGIVSLNLQQDCQGTADGREVVLSGLRSTIGTHAHQRFTPEETARAEQVLEDVAGMELAPRPFRSLSTGQQRRLLLARALVHSPEVLLLDEPTSGLDIPACFHYLATIRELMRRGKTMILVTHHIHEVPPEIDRIVLLKEGRIVADGPKRDVLTEQALSDLFAVPLRLVESGGFYQVVPG